MLTGRRLRIRSLAGVDRKVCGAFPAGSGESEQVSEKGKAGALLRLY